MPFAVEPIRCSDELRVAFFTDNGILAADADTAASGQAAARALAEWCNLVEERRPPMIERSYDLEMDLLGLDGGDGLREFLAEHRQHTDPSAARRLAEQTGVAAARTLRGSRITGPPWMSSAAAMYGFRQRLRRAAFAGFVQPGGSARDFDRRRRLSRIQLHDDAQPDRLARCGGSLRNVADGLPIGVQIAAAPWREDIALTVAELSGIGLRRLESAVI